MEVVEDAPAPPPAIDWTTVSNEALAEQVRLRLTSSVQEHKWAQCLAGAFAAPVEAGRLPTNPGRGLKVPKERAREGHFLTPDQVQRIAEGADGRRHVGDRYETLAGWYGHLVWFLATTGVRVGEACALHVGDVTQARGHWRARVRVAKGGRGRDVPVPPSVVAMLDLGRPASALLFVTPSGAPVSKDHFRARAWKVSVAAAGLADVRIHDLRHTAASLAIASGADVKVVQRMLGHRSAALTLDLYGHLLDRGLDDVSARMDNLVRTRSVPPPPD